MAVLVTVLVPGFVVVVLVVPVVVLVVVPVLVLVLVLVDDSAMPVSRRILHPGAVVVRAPVDVHRTPRSGRSPPARASPAIGATRWCAGSSEDACSALWTASVTSRAMCSFARR